MMDLIPQVIDGAIVLNLRNQCKVQTQTCENCIFLVLNVHNWIVQSELEYIILDLQDEKEICPTFLDEILLLRKRLRRPFVFAGVMDKPRFFLDRCDFGTDYPTFLTPEDAIRAIRMQHPGLTERSLKIPLSPGAPLLNTWRQIALETLGPFV